MRSDDDLLPPWGWVFRRDFLPQLNALYWMMTIVFWFGFGLFVWRLGVLHAILGWILPLGAWAFDTWLLKFGGLAKLRALTQFSPPSPQAAEGPGTIGN